MHFKTEIMRMNIIIISFNIRVSENGDNVFDYRCVSHFNHPHQQKVAATQNRHQLKLVLLDFPTHSVHFLTIFLEDQAHLTQVVGKLIRVSALEAFRSDHFVLHILD